MYSDDVNMISSQGPVKQAIIDNLSFLTASTGADYQDETGRDGSDGDAESWDSDYENMEQWMKDLTAQDPILRKTQLSRSLSAQMLAAGLPSNEGGGLRRTARRSTALSGLAGKRVDSLQSLPDLARAHEQSKRKKKAAGNNFSDTASTASSMTADDSIISSSQKAKTPEEQIQNAVAAAGLELDAIQPSDETFLVGAANQDTTSYPQAASAARHEDLGELKALHEAGLSLQSCNKYGESIVHITCRRGNAVILKYLMKEAKVTVRVKDDYGRTPLHDAAWTGSPNFDLVKMLLKRSPDLLLVKDKRGHLAVTYAPKDQKRKWLKFLRQRPEFLEAAIEAAKIRQSAM